MSISSNVRWGVKKSARLGVSLLGAMGNQISRNKPLSAYVLTYHRIAREQRDPFSVSPTDFEAHVRLLQAEARGISLGDLCGFAEASQSIPQDSCLITIDDGLLSTFTCALPILERYQIPAVVFVSSNLIGRSVPGMPERYMNWDELGELAASDWIEIGSHAHTHRSLGQLPLSEAVEEATLSKQTLESRLEQSVRSFAYPFGTVGDFNQQTDTILSEAGYSVAFNSIHGAITEGTNLFSLPRIKIEGGESPFLFSLLSHGASVPWRHVDQNLWRFQRVREEIE